MRSERFDFAGSGGHRLAGLLQLPDGEPSAYALFAHCFTCGKDVKAAAQLARSLGELGIATLRFDFTGLGASEGEFARTTFTSNVADLVAAADALRQTHEAPKLLIGHSLGGAAILAAAEQVPEAVAVATIGAPFDTAHAVRLFQDALPALEAHGEAEVTIAGRSFRVGRELVTDLAGQDQARRIKELGRALAGHARARATRWWASRTRRRSSPPPATPRASSRSTRPITCSAGARMRPMRRACSRPGHRAMSVRRPRRRTVAARKGWSWSRRPGADASSSRSRPAGTA